MEAHHRSRRGFVALAAATFLAVVTTVLGAQTVVDPAGLSMRWTIWLQIVVNLTKLVEAAVFVFSGYQFWAGRRDRRTTDIAAAEQARVDSIYQAWQVINSAQGKGGSGGRIEALAHLLRNRVSLAGINLDGPWLEGVELRGATLVRGSLQGANLSRADLSGANLEGADLRNSSLVTANLSGANLRGANLAGARLSAATLDGAELGELVGWNEVRSMSYASIDRLRTPPAGFIQFALELGALDSDRPGPAEDEDTSYSRQFRAL